ncbi:exodeoxyribonuclease VII small subunit [Microbaculum marinum]|uniref:Exodeoxyribonuclease 7 small subunit n=1 Tax=Microbaculum marinum TaxID=1764581 RepID=A0AAW9RMZ7_9HYPH
MTQQTTPPPDIAGLSFEDALKKLEQIVEQLEGGDVPLETSIEMYTRGEALKNHCEKLLKSAEARVERIVVGADGTAAATEPLDVD